MFPNFDNLGCALLILVVATSLNGYSSFMVAAMSSPQATGRWRVAFLQIGALGPPTCPEGEAASLAQQPSLGFRGLGLGDHEPQNPKS